MKTEEKSIVIKNLEKRFGEDIEKFETKVDYLEVQIKKDKKECIIPLLRYLKEDLDLAFNMLTDLSAVDYLRFPVRQPERFMVVYNLYSLSKKKRIIVKVPVSIKNPEVDSATCLWKAANWAEREIYDMYGIRFKAHPNLKRILNHHEFVGHPLRKDYPIRKRQTLSVNDSLIDEMDKKLHEKGLK